MIREGRALDRVMDFILTLMYISIQLRTVDEWHNLSLDVVQN